MTISEPKTGIQPPSIEWAARMEALTSMKVNQHRDVWPSQEVRMIDERNAWLRVSYKVGIRIQTVIMKEEGKPDFLRVWRIK